MDKIIDIKQLTKCDLSCLKCGSEIVDKMPQKKTWVKCYNCEYEYPIKERLAQNETVS